MNVEQALLTGVYGFIVVCGFVLSTGVVVAVLSIITSVLARLFGGPDDEGGENQ